MNNACFSIISNSVLVQSIGDNNNKNINERKMEYEKTKREKQQLWADLIAIMVTRKNNHNCQQ